VAKKILQNAIRALKYMSQDEKQFDSVRLNACIDQLHADMMFHLSRIEDGIHGIERSLKKITYLVLVEKGETDYMSQEVDDLKTALAQNSDLIGSAIQTINGIADMIDKANADQNQEIKKITADLRAKDDELANALVAGTKPPTPTPAPGTPGAAPSGRGSGRQITNP
jgi:hypothetical protein